MARIRGALFFKGAYTLATHEKPAVIFVLWCWHRALADLAPPRAPWNTTFQSQSFICSFGIR